MTLSLVGIEISSPHLGNKHKHLPLTCLLSLSIIPAERCVLKYSGWNKIANNSTSFLFTVAKNGIFGPETNDKVKNRPISKDNLYIFSSIKKCKYIIKVILYIPVTCVGSLCGQKTFEEERFTFSLSTSFSYHFPSVQSLEHSRAVLTYTCPISLKVN